jgi:hypothetical protein
VDYLKDKEYIEANPNTKFLMMYTMSCAVSLQVTEEKEASKEEKEKKKKKRGLLLERKEIEDNVR